DRAEREVERVRSPPASRGRRLPCEPAVAEIIIAAHGNGIVLAARSFPSWSGRSRVIVALVLRRLDVGPVPVRRRRRRLAGRLVIVRRFRWLARLWRLGWFRRLRWLGRLLAARRSGTGRRKGDGGHCRCG